MACTHLATTACSAHRKYLLHGSFKQRLNHVIIMCQGVSWCGTFCQHLMWHSDLMAFLLAGVLQSMLVTLIVVLYISCRV
jgi:hypothetical protein